MGRTIHYSVEKDGQNTLSDAEWEAIEALQDRYNDEHIWTCEQLALERETIYPNWTAWENSGVSTHEVWQRIEAELALPDGRKRLEDQNLIKVRRGGYRGEKFLMSGFTKVRENENNARLVVNFLLEASRLAPGVRILVVDEGDYLACPVVIQNGRMDPDRDEIKKHIAYWTQRKQEGPLSEAGYWDELIGRQQSFLNLPGPSADKSIFIAPEFRQ